MAKMATNKKKLTVAMILKAKKELDKSEINKSDTLLWVPGIGIIGYIKPKKKKNK